MRQPLICLLVVALAVAAIPLALDAKQTGKGKGKSSSASVSVVFTTDDQRIISNYFHRGTGLPPGLAKRESLPPGLEKQLRRKGTLPPGLEKKLVSFPPDLDGRLTRLPEGHGRVFLANIALILGPARVIIDIFDVR